MPVTTALRRLTQENQEFEASLAIAQNPVRRKESMNK